MAYTYILEKEQGGDSFAGRDSANQIAFKIAEQYVRPKNS